MRLIKLMVISIVVLTVVATFIGLLIPSSVVVSRAVDVNAPKDSIWMLVKDLPSWKVWMQHFNDSSVHIKDAYNGVFGNTTVQMEKNVNQQSPLVVNWISLSSGSKQQSSMQIISAGNNTSVVQWQFVQKTKWYPWERFSTLMNDKIMGVMLEKNLNRLKAAAEKMPMPEN